MTLIKTAFKGRSINQGHVWDGVRQNASNLYQCATSFMVQDKIDMLQKDDDEVIDDAKLEEIEIEVKKEIPTFTDDLKGNIDKFSKIIEKILQKVPYFENQVGLATLDLQGVGGIELFDLKQSWKAFKDDIVKKEGENLAKTQKESPFEYKKEKAIQVVKDVLSLTFEERVTHKTDGYKVISLNSEKYTGEITELNNEMIHCVLIRKNN